MHIKITVKITCGEKRKENKKQKNGKNQHR
jgi:hypothetical protein